MTSIGPSPSGSIAISGQCDDVVTQLPRARATSVAAPGPRRASTTIFTGLSGQRRAPRRARPGRSPDAALEPGAVFVSDERRQHVPSWWAATGARQPPPIEGDAARARPRPAPRLAVVPARDEILLTDAHLQRQRTLPGLGQHHLGVEPEPDLGVEPEPVETARGEHDGVEATLAPLAQPRVDVPAQRLDRERRLEREQLGPAAGRGGADPHPGPDRAGAAERVARILARV